MDTTKINKNNNLITVFLDKDIGHDFMVLKDQRWVRTKYHESWDWLMPVYDYLTLKHDVAWKITSKGVRIYTHLGQPIGDFDGRWEMNCPKDVLLDAYRGIIQFITWYNKQINEQSSNISNS